MLPTTLLFHANLLYAEIPFDHIPRVVERSYLPILELLLRVPGLKAVLNLSGFTLELLAGEVPELYEGRPEAVSLIKEAVDKGKLELTGTSWSHAILPLLPAELAERDIELFGQTCSRILGLRPRGFFPPELAISPLLPAVLLEQGYQWCFIDRDLLSFSEAGGLNAYNDFEPVPPSPVKKAAWAKQRGPLARLRYAVEANRRLKRTLDFRPIRWLGAENKEIHGLSCDIAWSAFSLICFSHISLMNERRLIRRINRLSSRPVHGLFIPHSSDLEFFGYGGNTIKEAIPVSRLERFVTALSRNQRLRFTLPSEYLKSEGCRTGSIYLKSGSWSPDNDFALWEREPDNALLNRYSDEAYYCYRQREDRLNEAERLELLKKLLLSYNSDGRGWTPLAEHRLFCLNQALEVKRRCS